MKIFRRSFGLGVLALAGALAVPLSVSLPDAAHGAAPARAEPAQRAAPARTASAQGAIGLRGADPSVLRVGGTYIAVQSADGGIVVRQASSPDALASAPTAKVWSDTAGRGEIWAPEIVRDGGQYHIYFSAGRGAAHRMYVISSAAPAGGYSAEKKVALPDDKWAIDGTLFTFQGQRWFVWSGWAGDTNVEQNLYIARMSDPATATGGRSVISQPRESWERVVGNPYINEAPEAIKDPNGQLHIVYSANGSWSDQYCLADLRLRAGGDPTYVWDWYKSNGCLFGSHRETMMAGWDPTLYVDGPGHHSFVLLDGDINTSPPAGSTFPSMFHAVAKGTPYSWENRQWYRGSFAWWGNTTYRRANVPGAETNTGWSLKFFE
ncbi:glycoside hydrolase family 43 protein [Streptomyces sp. NPDC049813]|uniref:glycoside hydrolase family 43 protein n=1 Tax=Streptomyces sp. NPDC049813 TaxID=3365597 RepID=UPI003788809E